MRLSFLKECLGPLSGFETSITETNYFDILGFDKRIREYPIPSTLHSYLRSSPLESPGDALPPHVRLIIGRLTCQDRESALLQLHREYLSRVLSGSKSAFVDSSGEELDTPELGAKIEWSDVLMHRYAPSVLATFISACRLIRGLDELFRKSPEFTVRYTVFWFQTFCGAVSQNFYFCAYLVANPCYR